MNITAPCPCDSGKPFGLCHAAYQAPPHAGAAPSAIVHAPPLVDRKIDLACGQSPREGYEGYDLWSGPGVSVACNLLEYPWRNADGTEIATSSVSALHCSHFIEHIPMEYVLADGAPARIGFPGTRDALLRFFDEAWRVLRPGGVMDVIAPCSGSNRAFQDPTHRRFIPPEFYGYLSHDVRVQNKLDHYQVECDFEQLSLAPMVPPELNALHPEVAMQDIRTKRNVVFDWHAKLGAKKAAVTP